MTFFPFQCGIGEYSSFGNWSKKNRESPARPAGSLGLAVTLGWRPPRHSRSRGTGSRADYLALRRLLDKQWLTSLGCLGRHAGAIEGLKVDDGKGIAPNTTRIEGNRLRVACPTF
jgi:hypothetical protein